MDTRFLTNELAKALENSPIVMCPFDDGLRREDVLVKAEVLFAGDGCQFRFQLKCGRKLTWHPLTGQLNYVSTHRGKGRNPIISCREGHILVQAELGLVH